MGDASAQLHTPDVTDSTPAAPNLIFPSMLLRLPPRRLPAGFIEPCLPSVAIKPPKGPSWIHEIKHDRFRLMAQRHGIGGRLLTRNGNDWSARYPAVLDAINALKVRSCLIDGEIAVCDESGLAVFQRLRHGSRIKPEAVLFAGHYRDVAETSTLIS